MMSVSLGAGLMVVLCWLESRGDRGFRYPPQPLSEIACGLIQRFGIKAFRLRLPGSFIVHFGGSVPRNIQSLCGSRPGIALDRLVGGAGDTRLDVGAGNH